MDLFDPAAWNAALSSLQDDMGTSAFWIGVMQIIWIDILLAGDNAVVIAMACRGLPENIRYWGMILGAGVAILMRIVFTFVVVTLMTMPFLKVAAGLALFYVAIKLLVPEDEGAHGEEIKASTKLWGAVRTIAIADVIMSLDNVIAIAAASKGNVALFMFGLAASIPLIIAGASVVMGLLTRFPVLVWAGGALLGWIAGHVIATDPVVHGWLLQSYGENFAYIAEYVSAVLGAVIVIAAGMYFRRQHEEKSRVDVVH